MTANVVGMIHLVAACKERLARADRAEGLSPFQRDDAEWEAYRRGEGAALRWMIQMLEAAAEEALRQEPHSGPDSVEGALRRVIQEAYHGHIESLPAPMIGAIINAEKVLSRHSKEQSV